MIFTIISIAVNLLLLAFFYILISRRFSSSRQNSTYLDEVRSELSQIVTELNQTTDRNIDLIEAKIIQLTRVVEDADQRITLLDKRVPIREGRDDTVPDKLQETIGEEYGANERINQNLTQAEAVETAETETVEMKVDTGKPVERTMTVSPVSAPVTDITARMVSDKAEGAGETVSNHLEQRTQIRDELNVSKQPELDLVSRPYTDIRRKARINRSTLVIEEAEKAEDHSVTKKGTRRKVLQLAAEGFDSKKIANQLGLPVGEVELIISLDTL